MSKAINGVEVAKSVVNTNTTYIYFNTQHTRKNNRSVGFGQQPRPLHGRHTQTGNCIRWVMTATHMAVVHTKL
jgi:hypothetical protein